MAWFADYPRDWINWSPTIDESKCVSCGICMNCGKGVYSWENGKPKVSNPSACVVGCSTCANLCKGEAISFPSLEDLRALYKKENMWGKVRKDLMEKGIIE